MSRHVKHLQHSLGVTLFRPNGRGLVLTEAGLAYHLELARAFATLRTATAAIRSIRRPVFKFWCTPGIVNRCLLPHLPQLTASLHRYEIHVQPTLAVPRLVLGEADAMLIYAGETQTDDYLQAEDIVSPRVFPVASPAFLDRHPLIRLHDFPKLPLLHEES